MDYITTPKSAELNAMKVMISWGYVDATSPMNSADGGIDVFSSRALAQVKWKGGVAGRPDLQRLYGARAGDMGKALFFFAASGYSKQAVEYADKVGIGLFTYDPTGKVSAVNRTISARPTVTVHSWVSTDYLALLHAIAGLWHVIDGGNKPRRRH